MPCPPMLTGKGERLTRSPLLHCGVMTKESWSLESAGPFCLARRRQPDRLFFTHRSGFSGRRCRTPRSNHPLRAAKILVEGALGTAPGFGSNGATPAPAPAEPGRQEPEPGESDRATFFGERMECNRRSCAAAASANQDPSLPPQKRFGFVTARSLLHHHPPEQFP